MEEEFDEITGQLEEELSAALNIARTLTEMSSSDTPTTSTPSADTPSVSKPTKPIMGGLVALVKDDWAAWTGGKPNHDWTGLASPMDDNTSPNQLRPVYASAAQKGYNHRRTGLSTQFTPSSDLAVFQTAIWNHLVDTGMDTIAYLQDPEDSTKMTNVVKSHARYTVDTAKLLSTVQTAKYDKYDTTNDIAARAYLLASIEPSLSNKVEEKLDDSDPFPIVWLQLIKTIQSTSVERFEDIKQTIKKRHPSQYPGENLEQLAADFRRDARELTTAGQYDHNLTLLMLKIFLLAGGSGNEDFRFPLRSVKQELDKALLEIGYKEKVAANQHMVDKKLTYQDICRHAEDTYRTLFDRKEWPPAKNVRDSNAPPSSFGNLAVEIGTPITRAEVLTLIQSNVKGDSKPGNCHKCGKAGHWANECPDNSTQDNRNRPSRRPPQVTSWRTTPPPSGSPTTKKHNDKTFNWCQKCTRWTTTHTTSTHTGPTTPSRPNHHRNSRFSSSRGRPAGRGGNRPRNKNGSSSANLSLLHDPSVWHFPVTPPPSTPTPFHRTRINLQLILSLCLGLYALFPSIISTFFSNLLTYAHYIPWTLLLSHLPTLAAPLFWLLIGVMIAHLELPEWYRPPDLLSALPTEPHFGLKQARLNRRYPLRLRSQRHYISSRPPPVARQQLLTELDLLYRRSLELQSTISLLRRHSHNKSPLSQQAT